MSDEIENIEKEVEELQLKYPLLTDKEVRELRFHVKTNQPKLGKKRAEQLQQLFNRGYACQEIVKANDGVSLAQVVRARIEFDWDEQRKDYLWNLMREAKTTIQQTQYESIRFITDGIAVHNKLYGEKFRKYLQTGNEADLGGAFFSGKQYREMLEMLLKLTGQDKQVHLHQHQGEVAIKPATPTTVPVDRPIEAGESRGVLKQLIEGKKVSKTEDE